MYTTECEFSDVGKKDGKKDSGRCERFYMGMTDIFNSFLSCDLPPVDSNRNSYKSAPFALIPLFAARLFPLIFLFSFQLIHWNFVEHSWECYCFLSKRLLFGFDRIAILVPQDYGWCGPLVVRQTRIEATELV